MHIGPCTAPYKSPCAAAAPRWPTPAALLSTQHSRTRTVHSNCQQLLVSQQVHSTTVSATTPAMSSPSVGIVGAGFGGLCMAIKCEKAGLHNYTVFEAADDIGGTWRANTYPGCACDVQSVAYSFSFEADYPWTEHYASQPEILGYLRHCADKFGLWDHIVLKTRVTGATYDEDRAVWVVTTSAGQQHEFQVLVMAQGALSIPGIPTISGLSGFKGPTLHTARWDQSVSLAGKRIAVVGSGASGIQVIPEVQKLAKELVVFQRTPAWVLPRKALLPSYAVPAAQHNSKWTLWLQRAGVFWRNELLLGSALVKNSKGTLKMIESLATKHMKSAVSDPQLQQALTPNFSIGCKRILSSDTYYPALAADNVRLVASGLKQVHDDGSTLEADNGEVVPDVDVIVFATGFDLMGPLAQFDIRGPGNKSFNEALSEVPQELYGLATAGFPNLFTLLGYNTGLGHHSVVFMIECQINLIMQLIRKHLLPQPGGSHWVAVRPEAQAAFNAEVQRRLGNTVWTSGGCNSWYLTGRSTDAAGQDAAQGNNTSNNTSATKPASSPNGIIMWPGLCLEFWWRTRSLRAQDWVVGKAAHPVTVSGDAAADATARVAAAGGKKGVVVARKEMPLQPLLANIPGFGQKAAAASDEEKGL